VNGARKKNRAEVRRERKSEISSALLNAKAILYQKAVLRYTFFAKNCSILAKIIFDENL